jgi:starch synthase
VRTLADTQAAAGTPVCIVLPLYGIIRATRSDLEPATDFFTVRVGLRDERVRVFGAPARIGEPRHYFVDHPTFSRRSGIYGERGVDYADNAYRFAVFSRAALAALPSVAPNAAVLHAHDWHTALAPVYVRTAPRDRTTRELATVLSVHNAGFQGHYPPEMMPQLGLSWELYDWRRFEWHGRTNILKGGLAFADVVTTVSPSHAEELRTPLGGFGLHDAFASLGDRLVGVLNGIDQHVWNPATDRHLAASYSLHQLAGKRLCKTALQRAFGLPERPDLPLFAFCARLVAQKGLDIILQSGVLDRQDAQFVFLGEGDASYVSQLAARAHASAGSIAARFDFTDSLEHVLLAGADVCLMPSVYEPCGLTQMRAQRYGTLPLAHRVGGLADTVSDGDAGFLFAPHAADALAAAVQRVVDAYARPASWKEMMRTAMQRDFGWGRSMGVYRDVYRRALAVRAVAGNT